MSLLEAPGARLYYETHGSGPLLLMVSGSNGTGDAFIGLAEHLAAYYTVVLYDRRGFSRSQLAGPQDYDRRLETDADDVRRLIEHLSDAPAIVVGVSSGAIIALKTLARHPSVARTIVPYEPPAVRQLPDGQQWLDFFSELYDLYRQKGIPPALHLFAERCFVEADRQVLAQLRQRAHGEQAEQMVANATYWFEHELRQYPPVDLDLDTLRAHASRIVPAAGRGSPGYPCYEVAAVLANKLGLELTEMPGGHLGCVAHPAEFAQELMQALARTGDGPKA